MPQPPFCHGYLFGFRQEGLSPCGERPISGSVYCAACLQSAKRDVDQKVTMAESEVATAKDKLERAIINRSDFLRKQGLL